MEPSVQDTLLPHRPIPPGSGAHNRGSPEMVPGPCTGVDVRGRHGARRGRDAGGDGGRGADSEGGLDFPSSSSPDLLLYGGDRLGAKRGFLLTGWALFLFFILLPSLKNTWKKKNGIYE